MGRKVTTELCIQDFIKVHGEKYDYSQVEYVHNKSKVTIICKKHGEFEQRPDDHKKGQGCKKCQYENKSHSNEQCIQDFIKVHGEKYDYSQVEYVHNKSKVTIICHEHGEFEQRPDDHKKGQGCKKCVVENNTLSNEQCIQDFIKVHGEKYDYSQVEYINDKSKVTIICPEHGAFSQNPNNHKKGKGCPSCAKSGYDSNKKGFFYIQRLFLNDDDLKGIKFGITNKTPEQRMKQQSRRSIYDHKLCYSYSNKDGNIALEIENKVKKRFSKFKANILKEEMQDGFTETLKPEYLFTLTQYVEKLVKELG